jgi:transcriptional regulator with XRE-family HTH domain
MEVQPEQLVAIVGSNVKRRREELKLTQQDLAARLGVNQSYISGLENGKRSPLLATLAEISEALQVEPCQLVAIHS